MKEINGANKKADLTVRCLISLNGREGKYMPLEYLNSWELSAVKKAISQRVGECLSDYYSVHIDEYEEMLSDKAINKE